MTKAHRVRKITGWLLVLASVYGIYRVYAWGLLVTPVHRTPVLSASGAQVALRMEQATFANIVANRVTWSVFAGRIDLERPPGGMGLTDIQSASIENIRDGKLYGDAPASAPSSQTAIENHALVGISQRDTKPTAPVATSSPPVGTSTLPEARPVATFSAQHGRYTNGSAATLPPELRVLYNVQWQFTLSGNVRLRTQTGDSLRAETIVILQLFNRRTAKAEQRIECQDGVQVAAYGVDVHANNALYDPANRTVDGTGGVRAVWKQNSIQAERAYWSLPQHTIRCPEQAAGVVNGCPFQAEAVSVNTVTQRIQGRNARLQFSGDPAPLLPKTGP